MIIIIKKTLIKIFNFQLKIIKRKENIQKLVKKIQLMKLFYQ